MMELARVNNVEIPVCVINNQRVIGCREIDKIHNIPLGTTKSRMTTHLQHFVEGRDYYKVSAKERHDLIGDDSPLHGNPNIKCYLFNERGYLMIVKTLKDDLAWKIQQKLVDIYFHAKEEELVSPDSSINDFLEIQLKMMETMQATLAESMKQIRLMMIPGNKPTALPLVEPKPEPIVEVKAEVVEDERTDFDYWKMHIYDVLDRVVGQDKKARKKYLSDTYAYITRKYGIVWAQEKRDYHEKYGHYESSNLELCYELEQRNHVYKNLLESALLTRSEFGKTIEQISINKYPKNPTEMRQSFKDLGDALGDNSKNHCAVVTQFFKKMKKYDINWGLYDKRYRKANDIVPSKVISKIDLTFESREKKLILADYANWVDTKLSNNN